jgi:hypothetical protein
MLPAADCDGGFNFHSAMQKTGIGLPIPKWRGHLQASYVLNRNEAGVFYLRVDFYSGRLRRF